MGTTTASTSRKILIPLATLVAAGAVAVGSGATWTSTTSNSVAVTSGTLLHTNSHNGTTMRLTNIKPGDTMTGTVVVTNTGTTDSKLDIAASGVSSTFSSALTVSVSENGSSLYSGAFSGLTINQTDIDFNAAGTATYVVTVTLDASATNADQNKTAAATFTWTQTQVSGGSITEAWS